MRVLKVMLWIALIQISIGVLAVESAKVQMHVGALKVLPIKNIIRVAIGKGDVVSSKIIEGKGLLLIAENPGTTQIRVWREGERESRISVVVTYDDPERLMTSVSQLLKNYPSVSAREVDGVVILEGYANETELEQLQQLKKLMPNLINMVQLRKIAADQMISMELKIVEFSKKQLKNLGIKWDSVIAGPAAGYAGASVTNDVFGIVSPSANGTSELIADALNLTGGPSILENARFGYLGFVSGITSQINLLMDSGDARLLAEPMLNTRSGEAASFLAGGEFPYVVPQDGGVNSIEFKEYGIKLDIQPVADEFGNIQSAIKTEVSSLDFSVATQGTPGLLSRKTESVVSVKDGETIVISGLVNSNLSKAVSKVPLLGDIPILGELFKSTDFQENKTELVIFVTPKILRVNQENHQQQLERAKQMMEAYKDLGKLQILD